MSSADLFKPVAGGRMSAQIVHQIVPLVRSGELQPGDRLPSERELADMFKVSRVTIRDALRVLEVMGLVEIRVGATGGAFITVPSPDIVGEGVANMLYMHNLSSGVIAEARVLLEISILDLVIDKVTDEDLEELREIVARSRELLEAGRYDTKLSVRFHSRLAECARNEAVTLLAKTFAGPLSMAAVRVRESRDEGQRRTVEEHKGILAAVENRDRDEAIASLRAHLLREVPSNAGSS